MCNLVKKNIICLITDEDYIKNNIFELRVFSNDEEFKNEIKNTKTNLIKYYICNKNKHDNENIIELFYFLMNKFCIHKDYVYNLYFDDLFYVLNGLIENYNNYTYYKYLSEHVTSNYDFFDYNRKNKISDINNINYWNENYKNKVNNDKNNDKSNDKNNEKSNEKINVKNIFSFYKKIFKKQ